MAGQTARPTAQNALRRRVHAPKGLLTGKQVRIACVVVGTVGLAALAVALIGPGRVRRSVVRPLRGALEPQAEKLWVQAGPLRAQLTRLMKTASPAARARLARNFQSWIGHFHAS